VPTIELPPHLWFESAQVLDTTTPEACFARADGWTRDRGLTPLDVFIKNVAELCSPVARFHAREEFARHRSLDDDGKVVESVFGYDMRIVVNFGDEPYRSDELDVTLPRFGFVVRYPFFYAFHALSAGGLDYDSPAFFTVTSLEGKMYLRAEQTRIYHGFGPDQIRLGGKVFKVDREEIVKIW
jgi:hypothetical protein